MNLILFLLPFPFLLVLLFSYFDWADQQIFILGARVQILSGEYKDLTGTIISVPINSKERLVHFDYSYDLQRIEHPASILVKHLKIIPEERMKGDRF